MRGTENGQLLFQIQAALDHRHGGISVKSLQRDGPYGEALWNENTFAIGSTKGSFLLPSRAGLLECNNGAIYRRTTYEREAIAMIHVPGMSSNSLRRPPNLIRASLSAVLAVQHDQQSNGEF